jgi:hypothetical protein
VADVLSNLGQAFPSPATLTLLFMCNAPFLGATVSSVTVCNQGSTPAKVRLSLQVSGAGDSPQQYLFYDVVLQPNETRAPVIGITMGQNDALMCQSDTGNVSFNASGVQVQ